MSVQLPPGGIGYVLKKFPVLSETFILNEILGLEARGVPVHIFSLERPNDPRFHDALPKLAATVSYVPDLTDAASLWRHNRRALRSFGRRYYRELAYAIAHARPSLAWRLVQTAYVANEARKLRLRQLHAHFATRPASVAFLASRLTGIPYSFTAHAMDIYKERLCIGALKRKIEHARFVVTVSDYNRQFLESRTNGSAARLIRLYNGIDLERFAPNGRPPDDPFTFICVARFVEKKGHRVLIEAARMLHERGVSFRCWLVGKGRLRTEIAEGIRAAGVASHVELLGPRTQAEVRELYHRAHACVLPCLIGADGNREGLPVSIVESLASGLPVITTPVTGIPEVVHHDRNGLLVPVGDAAALADAMTRLARDRELFERLRSEARASVVDDFDVNRTTSTLRDLFYGDAA